MEKLQTNKVEAILNQLESWFKGSSDIVVKEQKYEDFTVQFMYCPHLIDMNAMNEVILPTFYHVWEINGLLTYECISNVLETSKPKDASQAKKEIEEKLFSGEILVFSHDMRDLFFIPVSKFPKRSPEETNLESSVRGPRDGFVENISDNMALIRQRLKTSSLKCIEYSIGERSRTKVVLHYIDDIIHPSLLEEVKKRIESIHVDILVSSYLLEERLFDNTFSLFPLMDHSGRPDFAVRALTQGRFVILVDGNPSCLIGPTSFNQTLFSPEDMHESFYYISVVRLFRFFALLITIFLPGFYISLITFQIDQIPYSLVATISASRLGLPLSAPMETFLMLALFELFKEAGVRLPKPVGQTVAVLGGLFIGDAAIRAGLTSPSCLVVISITVISGYILINQTISNNIMILRFIVLFMSSFLGLYGFFIAFFFIITALASTESFGYPYLTALSRPNLPDIIKSVIRVPFPFMRKRNQAFQPVDSDREKQKE
ncbi:spore germination protein [Bacillus sinesaloumensis]|uniref:spore germination protein n=1 Tax=Litchfieldia sinesaloumensis TaxID=1926280 RepID=UPI000988486A|nr:spore germination protein [Bacillus sinesaloumensis]